MKFIVLSRRLIEQAKPYDKPHVIISVRTPGDPEEAKLPVGDHTVASLRLQFQEMYDEEKLRERDQYHAQRGNAFTLDTGNYVLSFIKRYADKIEAVIVHCDAGLARSPAIAYALSKTVFADEENKFFTVALDRDLEIERELKDPEVTYTGDIYEELGEKDVTHGDRLPTCFKWIMEAWSLEAELNVLSELLNACMRLLPEADGEDDVDTTVAKAMVRVEHAGRRLDQLEDT
jgi:predicted protein tyrosine phosphatase